MSIDEYLLVSGLVCLHCDEWACLCACDLDDNSPLKHLDSVDLRKTILARQLSGDPTKVNPDQALNSQARIIAYNPKLEISRDRFVANKILGTGHFGCVYSGIIFGVISYFYSFKIVSDNIYND